MNILRPQNHFLLYIFAVLAFACGESRHAGTEEKAFPGGSGVPDSPPGIAAADTPGTRLRTPDFPLPYDLGNPNATCKLPKELEEISGISYMKNGNLAVIEDEKGKIYEINTNLCAVNSVWKFGKDGDYEGIEVVGDTAWVIRSDGLLHKVSDFTSDARITEIFKTPLTAKNNVEGLGYLPEKHHLLLACKALPYLTRELYRGKRAVYAYDLAKKELLTLPYLLIDLKQVAAAKNDDAFIRLSRDLAGKLSDGGNLDFQPSGIALHPISGHIYVIASVGKTILVYNQEKQLIGLAPLRHKLFTQPEGICFSPEGTLYISNEGKGGAGNVLTFQYTPHEN